MDADVRCLKPLPIGGLECWATFEEQGKWVANGLMGSVSEHPFIGRLIDGLDQSVRVNRGRRPARMTGPQYVTRQWRRHPNELTVLPQRWFYPYSYTDVHKHPVDEDFADPDLVAVHLWHNRRRERGLL